MENIINAPANFTLPIPKGILSNSVTAQSAIALPLQAGGLIVKSGPAYVHAGEVVSKGGRSMGNMETNITNHFTIQGSDDPQEVADKIVGKINESYYVQNQRNGRYQSRF
jgi:hypothetical protein